MPPAGALGDTLSASSSLSLFLTPRSSFLLRCPLSISASLFLLCFFFSVLYTQTPPSCCLFFFSVPPTFVLLHHPNVSLLPPPFPPPIPLFYPRHLTGFFFFFFGVTPALTVSLNFLPVPCMSSVYHPRCLRSYEMSNFI